MISPHFLPVIKPESAALIEISIFVPGLNGDGREIAVGRVAVGTVAAVDVAPIFRGLKTWKLKQCSH